MPNNKNSRNHSSILSMEEVIPQSGLEKVGNLVKKPLKNPQTKSILGLVFLFFSTMLVVFMVQQAQRWFSKAAVTDVSLSFIPSNVQVTPTSPQAIRLWVTPGKPLGFINLEVNFDTTKLKLDQPVTILDAKYSNVIKLSTPTEANANGKIIISLGLNPAETANVTASAFALANLVFSANTANPNLISDVTFNLANVQMVVTDTMVLTPTGTKATLTINQTVAAGAKLYFSAPVPANPQTVNQNFTVKVLADTGNQDVTGVDAKITFDKTKLQVMSINTITTSGFTSFPAKTFDNAAGVVQISANIGSSTSATPVKGRNIEVASLTVKPIIAGDAVLNYVFIVGDRNDSNIVLKLADATQDPVDILSLVESVTINTQVAVPSAPPSSLPIPSPSASPVPQASASPVPSGMPAPSPQASASPVPSASPTTQNLTLKFKLQGRTRLGVSQAKSLTFNYLRVGQTTPTQVFLTTNANGEAVISLAPGQYSFLAKISGYLAKKFGSVATPVVINAGAQSLDLSAGAILGGDFNNDGTINEVDYAASFLPKFGTADATVDLDGSGQVNNLDFAIMRLNWNLINDTL